jgi:hypothetical protein
MSDNHLTSLPRKIESEYSALFDSLILNCHSKLRLICNYEYFYERKKSITRL